MDYSKYILRTAGCPALGDWAIKNKLTVKWGSAKRGDLVLFDFNGNGTSEHVGFVTKVTSTYIETIEGNTGSGSNTNGDGVYRRRRTNGQVNYFVRTKCPDIESVIRRAEAELGYKEGRNNNNKYGKWFGMNNVSWCCIFVVYCFAHALGETKPLPKPTGKYTGVIPVPTLKYGSEGIAVKNLQSFLNWYGCKLTVDGEFGSATQEAVKLFQKSEGISSDGIYGKNSYAKASAYKDSTTVKKQCIDTSYWQGKHSVADWQKVGKTCSHAIHRASFTEQAKFSLNPDSTFATNVVNAFKAGLKCGAYHYSQAITVAEAKKEANYLCDILDKYRPYINYYVVCDYEFGKRLNSKIGTKASDIANAFCDVVKARGYSPCIYANYTMLTKYLKAPKHPVWVAQYNSTCSYKGEKVLWQYTSSGSVEGISGNVDLSYVYSEEVPAKPTPQTYDGELPSVHVKKTASQVIADALKWGKWIAGDNTFHYGEYGNKAYITPTSKYYAGGKYKRIYDITHSCGCHFCNTNKSKKVNKASKEGFKGENWERTYVCNTFVTAMFAHGGMESTCLEKCRKGSCIGMTTAGRSSALDNSKNWTYKGKLAIKDLKAGDVLVSASHMQCVYETVSNSQVKTIEATSYIGNYGNSASKESIRIKAKKPSYTSVYRFTGSVDADIPIRHGEYSDRVVLWQKFLNWAGCDCGQADGQYGDMTLEATKLFQKNNGLVVDGEIGSKTIAKAKEIKK